jgi:hypothetical protein
MGAVDRCNKSAMMLSKRITPVGTALAGTKI